MTDARDFRRINRRRVLTAQPTEIVSIDTTNDMVWMVARPADAGDTNQDGIMESISFGGAQPRNLTGGQVAVKGTRANFRTAGRGRPADRLTARRFRIGILQTDETPVLYAEEYPIENPVEDI